MFDVIDVDETDKVTVTQLVAALGFDEPDTYPFNPLPCFGCYLCPLCVCVCVPVQMSESQCCIPGVDSSVALQTLKETRVLDLFACKRDVDAHLGCDGFNRLPYNTNTGSVFGGGMYVWFRRCAAKLQDPFPILDVALVVGEGTPSRWCGCVFECVCECVSE